MSAAARFALDVALAWLMPWRAVRRARMLRSELRLMIRVAADILDRVPPAERPGVLRQAQSGAPE